MGDNFYNGVPKEDNMGDNSRNGDPKQGSTGKNSCNGGPGPNFLKENVTHSIWNM